MRSASSDFEAATSRKQTSRQAHRFPVCRAHAVSPARSQVWRINVSVKPLIVPYQMTQRDVGELTAALRCIQTNPASPHAARLSDNDGLQSAHLMLKRLSVAG